MSTYFFKKFETMTKEELEVRANSKCNWTRLCARAELKERF